MTYDREIKIDIAVKTLKPGDGRSRRRSTAAPSKARNVSDTAADVGVLRTFTPTTAPTASSVTTTKLFPYTDRLQLLHGQVRLPEPGDQGQHDAASELLHDDQPGGRRARAIPTRPRPRGDRLPAARSTSRLLTRTTDGRDQRGQHHRLRHAEEAVGRPRTPAPTSRAQAGAEDWPTRYGATSPAGTTAGACTTSSPRPHGLRRRHAVRHLHVCFQDGSKKYIHGYDNTAERAR